MNSNKAKLIEELKTQRSLAAYQLASSNPIASKISKLKWLKPSVGQLALLGVGVFVISGFFKKGKPAAKSTCDCSGGSGKNKSALAEVLKLLTPFLMAGFKYFRPQLEKVLISFFSKKNG